ncbi:spermidine/putrescine ABC transporter ATP-binding protein PotA [Knoellia locipacati]|uniref:Spermidine/putrescine import ATP-binding protein PotA n=1 Tax=Knoellia locipacati TaxID=882824 RepID=A0A512T2K3_9MICO|nr:ABC transporter ATP-binding protein [Knoellia locipacati]GEQ14404.1 spermidine/putrescine import ATP-binding protein PotA [Knoellia locipacati]
MTQQTQQTPPADSTVQSARDSLATATPGRVTLRSLRKVYGDDASATPAVRDVDLDIEPGEFITLLGPSGCGKTTTLRMIAGFETPTAGEIRLDDDLLNKVAPNKRPMAMVFQSYALFPHLSVFDNVAYGLKLKKMPSARVTEEVETALTSMNLGPYRDRAPHQMSGGQQQRVALARALVMRPKVLLFDEPLSNLDAKLRVQMRGEIRRLQRRLGITTVFVTHDQDEAMTMSDRIVVMNVGVIEQVDTPEEIYRHPLSVFVADFIGRANFLDVDVQGIEDGSARVSVLGRQWTVPSHPEVEVDAPVTLLVRPESVRLSPTDGRAVTGSVGRVLSSMFYGESIEYDIETEAGNLVVSVADPHAHETFSPGDYLDVGFEEGRAWLMPVGDEPQ